MTLMKFNQAPVFGGLMDSFIGRELAGLMDTNSGYSVPAVNIKEHKESLALEIAAPGFSKDQFKLSLDHNVLTVSAENKQETEKTEGKYTRREFSYGSFRRSFTLPETIQAEKIDAEYQHGVLMVTLPKKDEAKVKAVKEISVR
jgi:HSP20 family protein